VAQTADCPLSYQQTLYEVPGTSFQFTLIVVIVTSEAIGAELGAAGRVQGALFGDAEADSKLFAVAVTLMVYCVFETRPLIV
jgi:hypothetical protein